MRRSRQPFDAGPSTLPSDGGRSARHPRCAAWEGIPPDRAPHCEDVDDERPQQGVVDLGLLFLESVSGMGNN